MRAQHCKRSWSGKVGPSRKRPRGILGAMESISIHDDDDDSPLDDDDDELLIDTDDELETSSHSLISRMEGFDEESYDEDDYDEELLSDDEVLKRRLEQQV